MKDITLNQVNNFVLRKQHLTLDSKVDDIGQIIKDICGLHATGPKNPYLSLFARTRNFKRKYLDEELYLKRNLAKIRCVRGTMYIHPKEMIPIVYVATKRMVEPASSRYAQYLGINKKEYEKLSIKILNILKGKVMTTREVKKALMTHQNISPVLNLMCDQGLLVRGPPRGGWKSNIHTYHIFHEYFPDIELDSVNETTARKILIKQYIASFGPVSEDDVSWWTGFKKGETRKILDKLKDQTMQLKISKLNGKYIISSSDRSSIESQSIQHKMEINLLPGLDPYLMGYKERTRYLDHKYYDYIFDPSGNATSTILLNGMIIGVWDFMEKPEPKIKIHLFKEIDNPIMNKICAEALKIGKFMANKDIKIKECDKMVPLKQRTAGGVMTPLKDCE
ncbi:MAG: winged helix DNA-binding domain-containing protein [Euryarchaeota archaeon]|nr:winged helix DNA-binding domain-containing protein [Euryarchaeota archaeon]